MDKKGMTLIELAAVIVIIAILTVMIAPNIIGMRQSSLRSTLNNKIEKIQNAAITYANDNIESVPSNFSNSALNYSDTSAYETCTLSKSFESICASENDSTNKNCQAITSKVVDGNTVTTSCEDYCLVVYIKILVEQGYLAGDTDDSTIVTNPITSENLNNERVCIRYDSDKAENRKLVAYIINGEKLYDALD